MNKKSLKLVSLFIIALISTTILPFVFEVQAGDYSKPGSLVSFSQLSSPVQVLNPSTLYRTQTGQIPDSSWVIECADCPKVITELSNYGLQLDNDGKPHIVYSGDKLYYTWFDGVDWQYEVVYDPVGGYTIEVNLSLDSNGYPHVCYRDYLNQGLNYAYRDASGWHIEFVDIDGFSISLELDSSDNPHIIYSTSNSLNYAFRDADEWYTETVDSGDGEGDVYWTKTAIALDTNDKPYLSFVRYESSIWSMKYAYRDASGWHIESLDSARYGYGSLSLVLDSSGNPCSGPKNLDS
jgi:hypothetical protein